MASGGLTVVWTKNGSESDSDVWDDRLLIAEYEKASRSVASAISEKSGNRGTEVNHSDTSSEASSNGVKGKGSKKKKVQWKVGHFCRCTFSEDGVDYEAQIIKLVSADTCRVRYIGYNNEEEQSISQLQPSKGHAERERQKQIAAEEMGQDDVGGSGWAESGHDHGQQAASGSKSGFKRIMPPPPPSFFPDIMHSTNEDECLASMLMSWYMSGYHTGYYKAMTQFKRQCKCAHAGSS